METTIERCQKCNGHGEVPSGHVDRWGRSCWGMCPVCEGLGAVEIDPEPEPPAPAVVWGGVTVDAPGYTQDQFERAMMRAFADDLQITTDSASVHIVYHPGQTSGYAVTRRRCGCPAGDKGVPCKHRAILIAHLDIRTPHVDRQWKQLAEKRPAAAA